MTPDAATWAKELHNEVYAHCSVGWPCCDHTIWQDDWLIIAGKALTLHAQAVENAVTDNNLEWLAVARQKEKQAVDAAVRAEREEDRLLIGRLSLALEQHLPPDPHAETHSGHLCDAECEEAFHLATLLHEATIRARREGRG